MYVDVYSDRFKNTERYCCTAVAVLGACLILKTPAKLAKERLLIQSHVMKVRTAVTISARKAEQSTDDNTSQQFELGQSITITLQKSPAATAPVLKAEHRKCSAWLLDLL
jgi:hypothetical protein